MVIRVVVEPEGQVREATVYRSSGIEVLDRSALKAVRLWRFVPDQEVRELAVPVNFILGDGRA